MQLTDILLGAIIGSLATLLTSYLSRKTDYRKAVMSTYFGEKLTAYTEFLSVCSKMVNLEEMPLGEYSEYLSSLTVSASKAMILSNRETFDLIEKYCCCVIKATDKSELSDKDFYIKKSDLFHDVEDAMHSEIQSFASFE